MECVLARFAGTVFSPSIMPFFQGISEYAVRLFNSGLGQWEDDNLCGPEVRMKWQAFDKSTQNQSGNPRKRAHSGQDDNENFQLAYDSDFEASSSETLQGQSRKRRRLHVSDNSPLALVSPRGLDESYLSTETEPSANHKSAIGEDADGCNGLRARR